MSAFSAKLFGKETKPVIGMIHVPALPGTPRHVLSTEKIIEISLKEARILLAHGVDALLLENMHDIPYLKRKVGPEITAHMAVIARAIKQNFDVPAGMQILAGANKEALAAAQAAGLDFIRAEAFVFAHVADEGIMESDAGELLRYRKRIGAENIAVFTDIKKKHASHALTSDTDIVEHAKAARFFLSDGVIVSGAHTGEPPSEEELKRLKKLNIPVLIGSGLTAENICRYYPLADAFIVGSYFKEDGYWENPLDPERLKKWRESLEKCRKNNK